MRLASGSPIYELQTRGSAVLSGFFPAALLAQFKAAASARFREFESGSRTPLPPQYRYNPFSNSFLLAPLCEEAGLPFGAPVGRPELASLLKEATGQTVRCNPDQCWVRKKYPPPIAPPRHAPNGWHQDGALGARFPPEPGPEIPMTRLITCWIPLEPCGEERPGLELVRRRVDRVLHFTELTDAAVRRRFNAQEFWTPILSLGDGLVFLDGALHRTQIEPRMPYPRMSIEYRFFPSR